jgi:hypothetical protein
MDTPVYLRAGNTSAFEDIMSTRKPKPKAPFPCPNCGETVGGAIGYKRKPEMVEALTWLAKDPERTPWQASKKFGVCHTNIAKARDAERRCPFCKFILDSDIDLI